MTTPPILQGNRFALTFLSYALLDKAVADEVLIDKTTGNLYYKMPDGTIIDIIKNNATDAINKELVSLKKQIDDNVKAIQETMSKDVVVSQDPPGTQAVGALWVEVEEDAVNVPSEELSVLISNAVVSDDEPSNPNGIWLDS